MSSQLLLSDCIPAKEGIVIVGDEAESCARKLRLTINFYKVPFVERAKVSDRCHGLRFLNFLNHPSSSNWTGVQVILRSFVTN